MATERTMLQRKSLASGLLLCFLLCIYASVAAKTLTVDVSRANVRTGPGITHKIVLTLRRGAIFSILETQQGWHKIYLDDGREVWIAGSIVQIQQDDVSSQVLKSASALPPQETPRQILTSASALPPQETPSQIPPSAPVSLRPPMQRRRVALVIGNASYRSSPLRNPVNDANDMSTALQQSGFEVTTLLDANQRTMETAILRFGKELRREEKAVGLFFYAGHGVQVQGANYLIPIGAELDVAADVRYEAVHVGRVLAAMDDAGNQLNIVILDACRNNPFARSWRSADKGLAKMDAATGTLIAYATAPGSVAADGDGRNGLYTQHLLRQMAVPDMQVERAFKRVRVAVMAETDGKQTPWESSSLTGDFYFARTTGAPSIPAAPPAPVYAPAPVVVAPAPKKSAVPSPEEDMWALVKNSTHREDLYEFLLAFPRSRYASVARLRLSQLTRTARVEPPKRDLPPTHVKVTFISQTPAVSYDHPNPVKVAYGEGITVTASKPDHHDKTITKEALSEDTIIDFGSLDRSVEKVGFFFFKYDNDTALDTRTRLMWMTKDYRLIEDKGLQSWEEALQWASKMNAQQYGGYSDWRVPTIQEYKAIYDRSEPVKSYRQRSLGWPLAFASGGGEVYWTSEDLGAGVGYAWVVNFRSGGSRPWVQDRPKRTLTIRLVRYGG